MASALLIFLWIQDELSIGTQYDNAPNLYRIMEHEFTDDFLVKNSWLKHGTNAGPKTRFQLRADTDPTNSMIS
jgi:hypothetical protein